MTGKFSTHPHPSGGATILRFEWEKDKTHRAFECTLETEASAEEIAYDLERFADVLRGRATERPY
jgi:hypothetical protein